MNNCEKLHYNKYIHSRDRRENASQSAYQYFTKSIGNLAVTLIFDLLTSISKSVHLCSNCTEVVDLVKLPQFTNIVLTNFRYRT